MNYKVFLKIDSSKGLLEATLHMAHMSRFKDGLLITHMCMIDIGMWHERMQHFDLILSSWRKSN